MIDIGYDGAGLSTFWTSSTPAWLVTPVGSASIHDALLRGIPATLFPTAEAGVLVRRLGP